MEYLLQFKVWPIDIHRYDDKKANYNNVSRTYHQNKTSTHVWSIEDKTLTDAGDGLGAEAGGAGGGAGLMI